MTRRISPLLVSLSILVMIAAVPPADAAPQPVFPQRAPAPALPLRPGYVRLVGSPDQLSAYWHDQRWQPGDAYACALYAQASVLEALGYDFAMEMEAARSLGFRDGWYTDKNGAVGLGQPLRARGIRYESFGTSLAGEVRPWQALFRLQRGLAAGHFALVNLDAQQLSYYRDSAIRWHTLWITGLRFDADGRLTSVIANDSYRGPAVAYPAEEFISAWGHEALNYYAIFVVPPARAAHQVTP
jgi:hypothetical protein